MPKCFICQADKPNIRSIRGITPTPTANPD